jgi:4-amino-4-deoxy-L-arabinose transferase-like glycosyltransferase
MVTPVRDKLPVRLRERLPTTRAGRVAFWGLAGLLLTGGVLRLLLIAAWRPAFLGYPDSGSYINLAQGGLFDDVFRPAGYPFFLRVLHDLAPNLSLTITVQHLLGMCSAVLLFLAVRRAGGAPWLGLVPAAIVLLSGTGVFLEHTPVSETLFVFVVCAALYAGVHSIEARTPAWPAVAGGLAAAAATVRVVGLALLPVLVLWLLLAQRTPVRKRLLAGLACAAAGVAVIGAYYAVEDDAIGTTGLSRNGVWNFYGRVAGFADCSEFTPPPGTRPLCERTPPSRRIGNELYVFDTQRSPAVRTFGIPFHATPDKTEKVAAFARTAAIHQPLDYLRVVGRDMLRYVDPDHASGPGRGSTYAGMVGPEILFNPLFAPEVERAARSYYGPDQSGYHVDSGLLDALKDYESKTRVQGPAIALLALLSLAGPLLARGRLRSAALLFSLAAWALAIAPVASFWWSARTSIPVFGPLGAAAALGGWATWCALAPRLPRRSPGRRAAPTGVSAR